MSVKAEDMTSSGSDFRTASDALRDLHETLKGLVSSKGLSILRSDEPVAPREAGLHPLSKVPFAQTRRKLNEALDSLKNAAQARETWEDDKTEKLLRVKHDTVARSRAVRASKAALKECRRMALTADPFATRAALALQRLRAVAEETGATIDKTMEGSNVILLVCGKKFIADFIFSSIEGNDIKVKVKFRYLTENDMEKPDEAVSKSFAELVEQEEFGSLKIAFRRLMDLEKLSASIQGVSLIESLRAFEEDLLAAQELEKKEGVTEAQRTSYGHGVISRTALGLRIRFTESQSAILSVEDAIPPVTISVGRSQLLMKNMSDGPVPQMQFSDMQTASVSACYVLHFEKPIVVCLSVAQGLQRVGGSEKAVRPAVVKASGAGRELFNREIEERKPGWGSVQKLLGGKIFDQSTKSKRHWSLAASEFSAAVNVGDGYIEFLHSGNDMMNGVTVSRVPICNPMNVKPVLAVMKQQLVFNELFTSCFREEEISGDALMKQPVEVVLQDSPGFMLLSLFDDAIGDIVSMAVEIKLGGDMTVTLKTSDGQAHACSDAKATKLLATCRNVPLTIATIVKMGCAAAGGDGQQ